MFLNKAKKKRLLKMIEEELEYNPYDKELLDMKKELSKESTNMVITKEHMLKAERMTELLAKVGIFKSKNICDVTDAEIDKAIELLVIHRNIKDMHKKLYKMVVEKKVYEDDEEGFLEYMDEYDLKVYKKYRELAEIPNV